MYAVGVVAGLYPPVLERLSPCGAGETCSGVQLGQVDELERPATFDPGVCRGGGSLRMDGSTSLELAHSVVMVGFI